MSGQLTFDVEQRSPVVVVRPSGVLDAYTAADLRLGLLACLAEQPAGLVLDAAELSVSDEIGLTVLASVAQQSEQWPGTRFALAAGTADFEAAANRMGVGRHVQICRDRQAALAAASIWPVPPLARFEIAPDRNAPGHARAAVHDFCDDHAVGDGDAAQLVASELVTNAVVHAGTPMVLTLRLITPLLHIAVRDGGDGQARIGGIVDESSESGRGLLLVDALATGWGSFVPDIGKIVWATVRVRPRAQPA